MATVAGCAGFAAVSGSSVATAVTMGSVALPEMKKYNYDTKLATGSVAAGGTLGPMIPPSMGFIIYSMLTGVSIGKLFIAGIFPGILQAVLFMITIYIICLRNPKMGPAGPRTSLREKVASLKSTWAVIVLFIVVIGGIYLGFFTPTEAAGIGAFTWHFFGNSENHRHVLFNPRWRQDVRLLLGHEHTSQLDVQHHSWVVGKPYLDSCHYYDCLYSSWLSYGCHGTDCAYHPYLLPGNTIPGL